MKCASLHKLIAAAERAGSGQAGVPLGQGVGIPPLIEAPSLRDHAGLLYNHHSPGPNIVRVDYGCYSPGGIGYKHLTNDDYKTLHKLMEKLQYMPRFDTFHDNLWYLCIERHRIKRIPGEIRNFRYLSALCIVDTRIRRIEISDFEGMDALKEFEIHPINFKKAVNRKALEYLESRGVKVYK